MKFYAIMPFIPSDVDFMAEEYKRFSRESKMNLMLPSMTLRPEGTGATLFALALITFGAKFDSNGVSIKLEEIGSIAGCNNCQPGKNWFFRAWFDIVT